MEPFIPAVVVFSIGVVVGAVAWHFVHAKVKAALAVAQNDVKWLMDEKARLEAVISPPPAPVVPPAPPAA